MSSTRASPSPQCPLRARTSIETMQRVWNEHQPPSRRPCRSVPVAVAVLTLGLVLGVLGLVVVAATWALTFAAVLVVAGLLLVRYHAMRHGGLP
jgi:Flp pilus assembly protein TadB